MTAEKSGGRETDVAIQYDRVLQRISEIDFSNIDSDRFGRNVTVADLVAALIYLMKLNLSMQRANIMILQDEKDEAIEAIRQAPEALDGLVSLLVRLVKPEVSDNASK